MKGSTYRRCYCRGEDGKPLGAKCPKLNSKRHGVWSVRQELPPREDGTRRAYSSGGHKDGAAAQKDLDAVRALLALPAKLDRAGQIKVGDLLEAVSSTKGAGLPDYEETRKKLRRGRELSSEMTVGDLLDEWLEVKERHKRHTTAAGYRSHVTYHLKPALGDIPLDHFDVAHVQDFFDGLADRNDVILAENAARREQAERCRWTKPGRPPAAERARLEEERAKLAGMPPIRRTTGPGGRAAILRTLRTACNFAIKRRYRDFNPAKHVELSPYVRPKGLLWTPERVARWRVAGEVPSPVMVWTPAQLGAFLDAAEDDRLYAFFHLVAHHGLRRGEGVGADWAHLAWDARELMVAREITVDGWKPTETDVKTEGSADVVKLDRETIEVLREHLARQEAEKEKLGDAWADTGKIFTQPDGSWLHPQAVSDAFRRIVRAAGLPPVGLRDLRHGAAALVKAGGGELHDAKVKLRHSTITLTSDTYMTLFRDYEEELAERSAAAVPRARRASRGTDAHAPLTQESQPEGKSGSDLVGHQGLEP